MRAKSYVASIVWVVGLVLVYVGERIVGVGTQRAVISGLGVALVLAALALRALRLRAGGDRRSVELALLGFAGGAAVSVLLYFVQSDAFAKLTGSALEQSAPKLAGALAALWPAVLVAALLPTFLIELSYAAMAKAPRVELGRIGEAAFSGLGLASAIVFAFALVYVATERDAKWDLSYFRTAKPGEASRNLVRSLEEPVQVSLFFPPANDVAEQVVDYFDDLRRESPKLEVARYDHALDVAKAKELGVSTNGVVVVSKGARREQLMIGQELEKARGQLRGLDQDIQKRLLMVARAKKTIYFTTGHGERSEDKLSPTDERATLRLLRAALKARNYDLRPLGLAEGLANEVPKDAAAVAVIGPTEPFLEGEVASLSAYLGRGGRLLLALDPETGRDFKALLQPLGLTFQPTTLANDVSHARKSFQVSDRAIIVTTSFSSHPSVTSSGRMGFPMVFMGAGALDRLAQHPAEVSIDFAVRAAASTWDDQNGNFNHDPPGESRKAWSVVAAVTRRAKDAKKPEEEGRAVVLADSDALGDELITVARGNEIFAVDTLKWLLGDEALLGATSAETDVPIQRSRKQDLVWFYSSIFVAPLAVVLAGYLASRRRRRAPRSEGAAAINVSPEAQP